MDYPWEHMPEQGRKEMRKHAQAVISAAHVALNTADRDVMRQAPEGWKLAPIEPNLDQYNAACRAYCDWQAKCQEEEREHGDELRTSWEYSQPNFTHSDVYRAMLAAAPTPPVKLLSSTQTESTPVSTPWEPPKTEPGTKHFPIPTARELDMAMDIRRIGASAHLNCKSGSNVLKLVTEAWWFVAEQGLVVAPLREEGIEADAPGEQHQDDAAVDRFVLKKDRFDHPAGTEVFVFGGQTYGLVREDQRLTGREHCAVTLKASGDGPFFTVPFDDLARIPNTPQDGQVCARCGGLVSDPVVPQVAEQGSGLRTQPAMKAFVEGCTFARAKVLATLRAKVEAVDALVTAYEDDFSDWISRTKVLAEIDKLGGGI
jgi:hypothetical protein